jgi:crotonobetainyl-CoA:carnitine CoA-transferase CaiB-like acyl-CoA transferase
MILGDQGADVIKVERRGSGDESRGWGPPFDSRGESAYFLACNRNKLSVAADLDVAADREFLRELISGADVVVDNYRHGALERRGLIPADLIAASPKLIWCTITGFGAGSSRPGYDFVVQAESGWMSITGEVGGAPMKVGVALADVIAGKDAAIAILASLAGLRRDNAVERRLFVSLQHSAVSALVNVAQNALVTQHDAVRWGNAHASLVPYELFQAADRAVVIAVGNDAQFASLVRVLASDSLADEGFATNAGRLARREAVVAAIRERVGRRTAGHWVALLERAGVPCGIVRTVLEALGDVASSSPLTGVAPLPPSAVRRPPPQLDEHGVLVRAQSWKAFARA